jgi:hypothetical protein
MDDLQLLQRTGSPGGTPTSAVLARGRQQLFAQIAAEESTTAAAPGTVHHLKRRPQRILLASAAAVVIAAGAVVIDVARTDSSGATAEAATVLREAASLSLTATDPTLVDGQYLRIDMDAAYTSSFASPAGEQAMWLTSQDGQLYVPADTSGEWVWVREDRVPERFFNEADRAVADQVLQDGVETPGETLTADGGAFYGTDQLFLGMPMDEAITTVPRDPQELLDLIDERAPSGEESVSARAFTSIANFLRTGAVPGELRAALYEAMVLIDGVDVTEQQATLDDRSGTAIGLESPDTASRQDIIVDVATGLLIGERTTTLSGFNDIPAGTVTSWTAITTEIVNGVPTT